MAFNPYLLPQNMHLTRERTPQRMISFAIIAFCCTLLLTACQPKQPKETSASIDSAAQIMKSWQSLNLAVTHFRNGDPIPEAQSASAWQAAAQAGQPAWCYYQGSAAMGKKYGKLYNYYALTDPRGFGPEGWRIPSLSDWQALNEVLDLQAALQLKAEKGWGEHCQTADVYGFAALPSGGRMATGDFLGEGTHATWWAHMEAGEHQPSYVSMDCEVPWLEHFTDEKGSGLAVRLLREESAEVRSANPN